MAPRTSTPLRVNTVAVLALGFSPRRAGPESCTRQPNWDAGNGRRGGSSSRPLLVIVKCVGGIEIGRGSRGRKGKGVQTMRQKKRSSGSDGHTSWFIHCPHCRWGKVEYLPGHDLPELLTCEHCGKMSASEAWHLSAYEYVPSGRPSHSSLLAHLYQQRYPGKESVPVDIGE